MKKGAGLAGLFILSLLLLLSTEGLAQKRLRFKAEKQTGQREDGVRTDYLLGDVVIRQGETTIYADSAIVRKKERSAEAFGNVRVEEGDSVNITALRLIYDGETGTAQMRENVVYQDGEMTLFTDSLDYNKFEELASYFGGGRMVDGQNVLVSERGVFDKRNQTARFYENVELRMEDGVVNSDTLIYNTETKVATFKGPTTVVRSDGTTTFAEEGLVYDTRSESTTVMAGEIENPDYVITGEKLNYDQLNDVFTAVGNVVMTHKTENVVITGGRSVYDKKTGYTYVYEKPVMRRPVEGDTLYLSADTLVAIEAELDADKRMLAYNDVRIYKKDLQGISDSLAYFFADSSIFFYQDPVLWNEKSQLTGDTISLRIRDNQIDQLLLHTNSFVISQDTLKNFNQVKGRQVKALFEEGAINRIEVDGNAESLYFVVEEQANVLTGMNRITSGSMQMHFVSQQLDRINVYTKPEGKFMPPHEIQEPDRRLTGFEWREEDRPSRESVLERTPKAPPASELPQEEGEDKGLQPEGQLLGEPEARKSQL